MAARVFYYTMHDYERGLEYRNRIDPGKMWPDVVLMYDRDKFEADERRKSSESRNRRAALMNTELPQIELADAMGKTMTLPAHDNSITVLTFWASTSENSKKNLGFLQAVHQKYSRKTCAFYRWIWTMIMAQAKNISHRWGTPFRMYLRRNGACAIRRGCHSAHFRHRQEKHCSVCF